MPHHTPVSFARNICPLFRPIDVAHMEPFGVRLADYAYMAAPARNHCNARIVAAYLSGAREPRMPVGGPFWTDAQIRLFNQWMEEGFHP